MLPKLIYLSKIYLIFVGNDTRHKKAAPPPTIEELKVSAIAHLSEWDRTPKSLIPQPTREFEIGEEAIVGALKDVVILDVLEDGYAYLYSCTWTERDKEPVTQYRASWWIDVDVPRLQRVQLHL